MKIKQFILLAIITTLFAGCSYAQNIKTDEKPKNNSEAATEFKEINKFMERLEDEGFSGAVLVAQNGKISSNGYGLADREKKLKATPDTIFSTGSITKQFTGAAILKLEMQGKLSVGDKITKYFDNVPADKQDITIHHLLTNSSGLPGAIGDDPEIIKKDAYLKRAFATPLLSKPGEVYEYSNVGFAVAAAIIEKVSGKDYEEYLHKNLFVPAEMKNTGYSLPNWADEQVAVGYRGGVERWGKMTEKYQKKPELYWNLMGNGGILSTVEDLYKWHLALKGNKILNEKAKEKLYSPHIREQKDGNQFYGYGWAILETQKHGKLIKHNGGNGMFFADFWRFPKEDTAIIIMTNAQKSEYALLTQEIAQMIFDPSYISTLSSKVDKQYASLEKHPKGKLIQGFIETILKKNVAENEKFINDNFHSALLKSVPAERLATGFLNLAEEIKGHQIESIEDKKDLVIIKYKGSPLRLTLTVKDNKIAGVDVDN